jgi:hypothetical protein
MLALGVCASLLATTAAEAQIFRLFDPATQSFVTYDTGPQVNRAERNRAQRNFAQPSRSRMPAAQFAAQVVDTPRKKPRVRSSSIPGTSSSTLC